MPRMLTALRYTYVEGMTEKRAPHREGHLAHIAAWKERGLEVAGALGDPPSGGFFIFDAPAAEVEEFVSADPYVIAGLVPEYEIEPYAVVAGLSSD